ncbi:NACHT and WD repeat domain-containing protein 2-like [Tubulanus polymorphus]|uniref:NACHT and WD repeat domain-containing protein 2-like n=1 Tax=Tubulanus polymorphus TaxID=672921 RepID=UPI003DA6810F
MEAKINKTPFQYPEKVGLVRRAKTELDLTMPPPTGRRKISVPAAAAAATGAGAKPGKRTSKDGRKSKLGLHDADKDKETSPIVSKKQLRAKTATTDKRGKHSNSDNESSSKPTPAVPHLVRRKTRSDLYSSDRPKTSSDRPRTLGERKHSAIIKASCVERGKTLIDELLDKTQLQQHQLQNDEKDRKSDSNKKKSDLDSTVDSLGSPADQDDTVLSKTDSVFRGCLDELPPLGSRIVRIFTSSTFTDTTLERNALMENVYPLLKKYCREKHGLEFQVVDMRWGVRDEATDDHMTTELCMKEIENCQRLSTGPNFVVFLGQKYGYRPMPTKILATLFDAICDASKDSKGDLDLLRQWYKLDNNSIPAVYILQPISSILTNYNNKRHKLKMEQDRNLWWEIFGKITRILRKCSYVLQLTRKINKEEMHDFFMSVTEREIVHGILTAKDVTDHCLAYIRIIENVNKSAFLYSCKFMDFSGRKADEEAAKLLAKLRDERLPKKLPESNLARFTVEWSREGVDNVTHAEYLQKFCDHFHEHVNELIDRAVAKNEALGTDSVYIEILQHLHACQNFCKIFQGREEVVAKIRDYVTGDSELPLVLHGESGCGKTSLLAKAASEVAKWKFSKTCQPILVLRFLGTSPNSSTIMPLLQSLCTQISTVYGESLDEIPSELAPLCQYFKRLVAACATYEKPLLLFLDSLDQLSGADGAHSLAWLPIELPPNMKIVVSTLPNYYGLLDTLRRAVPQQGNFVQVTPLGPNLSSMILTSWLNNANRQITAEQWSIVTEAISKCNLPLFVKLVFDEICRWKSYSSPASCELSFTIHDNIVQLFEKIEKQHGRTLVSRALGYITASKSGISEAELEDLLSLDEKVLNDVYQWHLPPVRRIPPLLWTRIRNDLPGYLSEREADGINVIDWYHRQFIDASRERYFRNVNLLSEIHSNLAEYYRGTWAGKPKPYEFSDLQRQRFNTEERGGMSDRKVSAQPLAFTDDSGDVTRYNLRKLNELPHHYVRSHRYELLISEVLFNYKWLHAKLSCMPLQMVLGDFEDALNAMPDDKDIALVADALRLSSSVLSKYPDMLAPQILGRLLPYYSRSKKINALLKQCDTDGLNDCALVPAHHYLHTPGGPLHYSLEGHPFAPFGIAITSDLKYLVSASNQFIIWDLKTGEIFRVINPGIKGIMSNLMLFDNDLNAVSFTNNDQVLLCNIITGQFTIIDQPLFGQSNVIGLCVSADLLFAVWSNQEVAVYDCNGELVARHDNGNHSNPIIHVQIAGREFYCLNKTGSETDDDMTLNTTAPSIMKPFELHSAIAVSKDGLMLYACIAISDNAVAAYRRTGNTWKYERTLPDNTDNVYCLTLSSDGRYVAATGMLGYRVWEMIDLFHCTMTLMRLPPGIRNIPNKNPMSSLVAFSENNQYFIAGVRKVLYVWQTKTGELLRSLDAHFGRIIALTSVPVGANIVVSSSIDKSIKVWNFDNIRESVNHINRHEKPIEGVSLAGNDCIGAAVARNCVGLWNLQSGQMTSSLMHSGSSAIVTHAQITTDARYVISAESGKVLIWDVESKKAIKSAVEPDVLHLVITGDDRKFVTVSKSTTDGAVMTCRGIPSGSTIFAMNYTYGSRFLEPVITTDGLFIVTPAVDKKGVEVLSVYHAKTGTHLYDTIPKYNNYIDYNRLIAIPGEPTQVGLIDHEKGNIWDIKKKSFVRSVLKWNGQCTKNGKYGLYAPTRGGLQLLDLKNNGHVVHQLIPKVAEGVFSVKTLFTRNDQHVLYYHSGHRTLRVFRVADGKRIANYKAHADVTAIIGAPDGAGVVLGCTDGSVTMFNIADPIYEEGRKVLRTIRERLETPPASPVKTTTHKLPLTSSTTQKPVTSSTKPVHITVASPSEPEVKINQTKSMETDKITATPGDTKPTESSTAATPGETKPAEISTAATPGETKPTESSTAATPGETKPTDSSTAATPGETKPTESSTAATPGETKPTESSTAATPGETKPTESSTAATPGETKPTESSTAATPGETKPTDSSTAATPGETKPTDSSTAATPGETKPTDSSTAATPGDTKTTEFSTAATPGDTKPTDSSTAATPGETKPTDSSTAATPGETKPTESSTAVTPGDTKPTDSSTAVTPGDTKTTEFSTAATPGDTKPIEISTSAPAGDIKTTEVSTSAPPGGTKTNQTPTNDDQGKSERIKQPPVENEQTASSEQVKSLKSDLTDPQKSDEVPETVTSYSARAEDTTETKKKMSENHKIETVVSDSKISEKIPKTIVPDTRESWKIPEKSISSPNKPTEAVVTASKLPNGHQDNAKADKSDKQIINSNTSQSNSNVPQSSSNTSQSRSDTPQSSSTTSVHAGNQNSNNHVTKSPGNTASRTTATKNDDSANSIQNGGPVRKASKNLASKLTEETQKYKSRSAEDLVQTSDDRGQQQSSSARRTSVNAAMLIARQVGKMNHRRKQNPQSRACLIS